MGYSSKRQKYSLGLGLIVGALLSVAAGPADPALFTFAGKAYHAKDLATAEQQAYYDVESDHFNRLQAMAQQAALNLYFDSEAKRTGKTRVEAEAAALAVPDATDKQVSEWFEQNKARIPPGYTLEKVAPEIKNLLRDQAVKDKREALLAKLKSDGKFVFTMVEPEAPVVEVNTTDFPFKGAKGGKVTVVEFADYQCPHCKTAAPLLDDLVKKHPDNVRFVFMDFPIKGEFSQQAAQGAYCAGEQGKFWEFHDLAYDKQRELGSKDAPLNLAKELKLDEAKFSTCLGSDAAKARVAKAKAEGERLGLNGTPSIFINGRRVKNHDGTELEKWVAKFL